MRIKVPVIITLALLGGALTTAMLYRLPAVNDRLSWRLDAAMTYLRGVVRPVQAMPTPVAQTTFPPPQVINLAVSATPTPTTTATATPGPTPTHTPSPTPIPAAISLTSPAWEKQDWNNCGPATLALYLRAFGWEGDQFDISDLLKPERGDRNVNVEELVYYVRTRAGWLSAEFRVGGDTAILKQFLAAGLPVMIEEGYYLEAEYWPNDDRWAGHYLLLTGYDDASNTFTAQDSFVGPDRQISYETVDANWRAFNRVYVLLYLPSQEGTVRQILGPHWDVNYNREQALDAARRETEAAPQDAWAWFNLGTNLVYFERYREAAQAYDTARNLGLPQRMLRYQFGPFFAYFHAFRNDDLLALTEYALQRTPNSEEALLWRGWARYRQGENASALSDFRSALEANRFYQDAQYALEYVRANP